MTALSGIERDIRPSVKGCPEAQLERAIINSAIEFFRRSAAWRVTSAIDSVVIDPLYPITVPANTTLVEVERVTYEGEALVPTDVATLDAQYSNANQDAWTLESDTAPTHYLMEDKLTLRLWKIPTAPVIGGIGLTISVMPTEGATEIDDDLYDEHREDIGSGALARLLIIPNKDWTDPKLAAHHKIIFGEGVRLARERVERGRVKRTRRVTSPYKV